MTEEVVESPEVTFEPLVSLPPVEINTLEENEEECFNMRAKLFRFASESDPPEWKERGIGEVRLLRHKTSKQVRLLMRRDKTRKICANHYLTKAMKLLPSAGSDRAWVWTVLADFADEEPKMEQLAIRLKNAENALKFKTAFEQCQESIRDEQENEPENKEEEEQDLSQDMSKLAVTEDQSTDKSEEVKKSDEKEEEDTQQSDNKPAEADSKQEAENEEKEEKENSAENTTA